MIKIHTFNLNLLLILFLIYFSQGLFFEIGTWISKGCLLIIIFIDIFYFFKILFTKKIKNSFNQIWIFFIILNIIGFIFTTNFNSLNINMFKNIMVFSLTFFPFYFLSNKNFITNKHFIYFFILMLIISIFQFYNKSYSLSDQKISENIVNNLAYNFVSLIPFLFFIKRKKILSAILLFIIIFHIIIGNKRGALVVSVIPCIIFIYFQFKTLKKRNKIKGYIIILILLLFVGYFSYKTFVKNEYFIDRIISMTEGNSSGRDIIYSKILNAWCNSDSILNIIFGFGFAGSIKLTGGSFAHNDWLELLSNYGLIGIFSYALIFIELLKIIHKKNIERDKKILLFTIFSIWSMSSLFSMFYSSINATLYIMLLAYLVGNKGYSQDTFS